MDTVEKSVRVLIKRKSRYALRALLELAKRAGQGPVKVGEIARAQAIPTRFLEAILGQLKQGGFVDSKRGKEGGYILVRPPEELTVGEVLRFIQGPLEPVECLGKAPRERCPLRENCVFMSMWEEARRAVSKVYDSATFRELAEKESCRRGSMANNYAI